MEDLIQHRLKLFKANDMGLAPDGALTNIVKLAQEEGVCHTVILNKKYPSYDIVEFEYKIGEEEKKLFWLEEKSFKSC